MDALDRLRMLSSHINLEPAEETGCPKLSSSVKKKDIYISQAVLPGGERIPLLKTLLTSACERNCYYCPFRAGRDFRRTTFKPEELGKTFMSLYQAGIARGIFLSSGIIGGGIRTQDQLIASAEILRHKLGYQGYLHLKIMPGVERAQVERAMQLADRVSINLEAPNTKRLVLLAPRKEFTEELFKPLHWVEEIRRSKSPHLGWNGRWPSLTTQFVVGAVGENDVELLKTTEYLYRQVRLRRAYFSAFSPIVDTPLENHPAESPEREQRLYQASFLLRDYGFKMEELPFDPSGNLPLDTDPKLAWAQTHLSEQPIEINRASPQELMRIPGIGPIYAKSILNAIRKGERILDLSQLGKLGINTTRVAPYILINGKRQAYQPMLWEFGR
jgi:predicted DNA-binding helix-hairpin-helix protein